MIRGQFGKTKEDARQEIRQYVKTNREDWKELGFRTLSAMVHDEDREYLLADIDLMKSNRMVIMAEDSKTDQDTLILLSRRNITRLPSVGDFEKVESEASDSTEAATITSHLSNSKTFCNKFRGLDRNYHQITDNDRRVRAVAKAVAYSAMAAAYFRLACVVFDTAPKVEKKVFGDGEAAT